MTKTIFALNTPPNLAQISNPPKQLYYQGNIDLLNSLPHRGLGIVGTRNPQIRSKLIAEQTVEALRGSGLVILSGLARGIDATAHLAALKAGLPTIAVLGAGLDIPYPVENLDLREDILKAGGLVISEYGPGVGARAHQFLHRNRLIAGWSQATLIVEAGFKSGALNTARWARELNRTCFAVPCFPGDPFLVGNQLLLDRDHALALWGPHSLGAVWLELATHVDRPQEKLLKREVELIKQVVTLKYQKGGSTIPELQSWALDRQWTHGEFFETLHKLVETNRIQVRQGVAIL